MNTCIVPLVALLVAHGSAARTQAVSWNRTRPLTPLMTTLLVEAARTPAITSQLEALERTDVVVYLSHHVSVSPIDPTAYLRFVSHAGGQRYLLVQINCWQTTRDDRLASLGHELQHALEIASAPEVHDTAGIVRLYQRIGFEVRTRQWESRAARAAAELVRHQLGGQRR